jgi:hypothetical protein
MFGASAAGAMLATATAPSCEVFTIAQTPHSLVKLSLSVITVDKGSCIEFANTATLPTTVRIAATGYSTTIRAKATTSGSSNYVVTKSVTVKASSGLRTGTGSITSIPPSPPPSSPAPTISSTPSATPDVTPTHHHHRSHHPARHSHRGQGHHGQGRRGHGHHVKVSLPPLPPLPGSGATAGASGANPLVAPGLTSGGPGATGSAATSATTPVATVVAPGTRSTRGLPMLVGVLVVAGLAAAYGRAVLAYRPAVDNLRRPGHRA